MIGTERDFILNSVIGFSVDGARNARGRVAVCVPTLEARRLPLS